MTGVDDQFDLWTPQARANPLPIYARMREEAPAIRLIEPYRDIPLWIIPRHADVLGMLRDERLIKDMRRLAPEHRQRYASLAERSSEVSQHLLATDPPDHTRLRALVAKGFTPRRTDALRPRIEDIARGLLDAVQDRGAMDLIADFAFPLPITVIAEMLGIPDEDREQFRQWTSAFFTLSEDGDTSPQRQAGMRFAAYFQNLLTTRQPDEDGDLVAALLAAEEQGGRLSPPELLSMMFLLLIAGHETTVNLIGNGILALLQNPEQLEALRADPARIDTAVEEMLRYCGPVENTTLRFAGEDIQVGDQTIPEGDVVMMSLLSADHDPQQFEKPDVFDITRTPNKHIAFGHGIHFCLGAALARLEARIAIEMLLERMPALRLAVDPDALVWNNHLVVRGLRELPVAF